MRKLTLFATIAATLLAVSGCARWTLRPLHGHRENAPSQTNDRAGALSSLMHSQSGPAAAPADAPPDPAVQRPLNAGLEQIPRELAVARLSERQGDENQAVQIYQQFIASDPKNPLPHHRLGVMAARKSKLDEAEKHLRKALEVAPPSVELLNDMGYLCYLQSRFDEAEHYLLQALEQSPDNSSSTNNLAMVYGARGDFSKSLHYFRRVNDDAKSHANVAFTMTQQGKLEDARNEYLHALTIDKSLKSAANALVQIEQTRKAAERAAKRNGNAPEGPQRQDDVIELASTARPQYAPAMTRDARPMMPTEHDFAQRQPTREFQPTPPAYQPQPRRETVAAAPAPQREMPAAAPADQFAGRLMALPPLPDNDVATSSAAPARAEREPAFLPVAQAQPVGPSPVNVAQAETMARPQSQYSQFASEPVYAERPIAEPQPVYTREQPQSEPTTASIFSEARQVGWNAQPNSTAGSETRSRYSAIPIPTTAPNDDGAIAGNASTNAQANKQTDVQQAIAVAPTKPVANSVRPAAVHFGLSDDSSPSEKPKPQPATAQFSDFGTAPARLR